MVDNMVDYMDQGTGYGANKLRYVDTPFHPLLTGDHSSGGSGAAPPEDSPQWGEERGILAPKACSILMKILYGARLARWDLLKIVQLLSSRVTNWIVACDIALHRLICYINSTADLVLSGYVGDSRAFLLLLICMLMPIGREIGVTISRHRAPSSFLEARQPNFHLTPNVPSKP